MSTELATLHESLLDFQRQMRALLLRVETLERRSESSWEVVADPHGASEGLAEWESRLIAATTPDAVLAAALSSINHLLSARGTLEW